VKIVAGRHVAEHERKFARGEGSTLPAHRARRVEAVPSARAKCFVKREHLFGLGADAVAYITEVIHRRPKVWLRDVDELHDLLEIHGDRNMRIAIAHCLEQRVFGHEYIAHHLNHPIAALGVQQELFS
jgi:hypothetical protein